MQRWQIFGLFVNIRLFQINRVKGKAKQQLFLFFVNCRGFKWSTLGNVPICSMGNTRGTINCGTWSQFLL